MISAIQIRGSVRCTGHPFVCITRQHGDVAPPSRLYSMITSKDAVRPIEVRQPADVPPLGLIHPYTERYARRVNVELVMVSNFLNALNSRKCRDLFGACRKRVLSTC